MKFSPGVVATPGVIVVGGGNGTIDVFFLKRQAGDEITPGKIPRQFFRRKNPYGGLLNRELLADQIFNDIKIEMVDKRVR